MPPPRLRVASDVGGTFTDNLAYDEAARHVTVAKVPTTPENRALGTVRGLRQALAAQNRAGADVAYVGHGMTTATNAVIQRSGGRVAFITNEGFRDLLLIGRQNRPSLYDIRKTRPPPLVPREDCHTVRGRLDPSGREITPLDEAGLRNIAQRLSANRVEAGAIACCMPSQIPLTSSAPRRSSRQSSPASQSASRPISSPSAANTSAPARSCSTRICCRSWSAISPP